MVRPRWRGRLRLVQGRLRAPFYTGTQRLCPLCERTFRTFLAGPVDERPDAICPRCGSAERHRLVWLYLRDESDLFDSAGQRRILHVAPEPLLSRRLGALPGVDYVSGDLSGAGRFQLDLTALPFEDRSFDVVLCLHVLEHIPDDRAAMREIARVLRGWGIVQVPIVGDRTVEDLRVTDRRERLRLFGQEDHVRVYGRDYVQRLQSAGLDVIVDDYVARLGPETIELCGLDPSENIFLVRPEPRASRASGVS